LWTHTGGSLAWSVVARRRTCWWRTPTLVVHS
jgi:hypothetical protein